MRRMLAAAAAVLTVVLLPLALLSSWVAGVVTDTDRYVSTVAPLATDPTVKKAVVAVLEQEAADQVKQLSGLDLGPEALRVIIHSAATAVVVSPAFRPAWEAANRSAHKQLLAVLEGDDATLDDRGRVSVELGTLLNTVVGDLTRRGLLPETMPEIRVSFPLADAEDLERARYAYEVLDALGFWLPVLWVIAFVVAMAAAVSRSRMLQRLSGGAIAGMLLLRFLLSAARGQFTDGSVNGDLAGAVWDVLTRDLERVLWSVAGVGLLILVAAAVGRFSLSRPRTS